MTTKRSSAFGSAVLKHLKERPEFSFFLYNDVWRIELTFTRNLKKYQMVFPFVFAHFVRDVQTCVCPL